MNLTITEFSSRRNPNGKVVHTTWEVNSIKPVADDHVERRRSSCLVIHQR